MLFISDNFNSQSMNRTGMEYLFKKYNYLYKTQITKNVPVTTRPS